VCATAVNNAIGHHVGAHINHLTSLIQKKYSNAIPHAKGMNRIAGREPKHFILFQTRSYQETSGSAEPGTGFHNIHDNAIS
jgi:hypothetical protein